MLLGMNTGGGRLGRGPTAGGVVVVMVLLGVLGMLCLGNVVAVQVGEGKAGDAEASVRAKAVAERGEETPDAWIGLSVRNDFYDQPESLSTSHQGYGYGFEFVAEPFRSTVITVQDANPDAVYSWSITRKDGETSDEEVRQVDGDSTVTFSTSVPGVEWALQVTENDKDTGDVLRSRSAQLVSKYVRRDIYSLTEEDREKFLMALAVVHSTSQADGLDLYGDKWVSSEETTLKHMGYYSVGVEDCTPFHDGSCFYTTHTAFIYETERSMQLVAPSVALAYWDYTQDAEELRENWQDSEAFAYFGVPNDDGTLASGPLAHTKVPVASQELDTNYKNSFGFVVNKMNNNPSPYVSRFTANGMCGVQPTTTLPGCSAMLDSLQYGNLFDTDQALEFNLHGPIHHNMGGATACAVDFSELLDKYPDQEDAIRLMAALGEQMWSSYSGKFSLPDTCAAGAKFEDCKFFSDDLAKALNGTDNGRLDWDTAYGLAGSGWDIIAGSFMNSYTDEDNHTIYQFDGLSNDENEELYTAFTTYALSPASQGHFLSASAAPSDPIFASTHVIYERIFTMLRLSAPYTGYNFSFVNDDTCVGHKFSDLHPFQNFLNDDSNSFYSNEDLWHMFNPTSVEVPYIFDDLTPYCVSEYTVPSDWSPPSDDSQDGDESDSEDTDSTGSASKDPDSTEEDSASSDVSDPKEDGDEEEKKSDEKKYEAETSSTPVEQQQQQQQDQPINAEQAQPVLLASHVRPHLPVTSSAGVLAVVGGFVLVGAALAVVARVTRRTRSVPGYTAV